MLEIVIRGGPVMIPLLFCSVLAVAVGLERLWYLVRTRADSDDLMDDVRMAVAQRKVLEAMQRLKKVRGPVAAVLTTGLAFSDRDRQEIQERVEHVGHEALYQMERRLIVLDSIVTIAPLLGLLGTVTGIIRSFRVLAAMEGIESPSALSIGIAEALITTAAGLVIAIPTMALYNWISNIIDKRLREMKRRSVELLDLLDSAGEMPRA